MIERNRPPLLTNRLTILVGLGLVLGLSTPATAQMRTWTDATGEYEVEAEFLSFQEGATFSEGKVWLRRDDRWEVAYRRLRRRRRC